VKEATEILKENIVNLNDALKWLDRSYAICDELDIQQLDAEGMDAFESFTSRFARVSDILFNKVFRSIYYLEQGENASWLDVTLFMEKKAIIDNLNQARIIKETRNDIVHEYTVSDLNELFDSVNGQTPQLMEYAQNAIHYSEKLLEQL
jgi:hypothetical protein